MRPQIAVFGGSFNPPGLHHRQVVEELVKHVDRVIVVPCGPRPDQLTTNDVEPVYRAALTDITFRDLPNVEVDLFDLEQAVHTPTDELDQRYSNLGDIWHVVGSDLTEGGTTGDSVIQKKWKQGDEIWNSLRFVVVAKGGYQGTKADLPPQSKLITLPSPSDCTCEMIREKIFMREPYEHLVTPEVKAYIERYGLYRGRIPSKATRWTLGHSKVLLFLDQRNPKARACADKLRDFGPSGKNPIVSWPSAATGR